jgi:hypothetical protein
MKEKVFKVISIIICSIILAISVWCLFLGIGSIGEQGWGALGVIFIFPALIAIAVVLVDLLITLDVIKGGYIYSLIITIIKGILFIRLIPSLIYNIKYELKFGVSNTGFDIALMVLLLVMAVPSLFNLLRLKKNKK